MPPSKNLSFPMKLLQEIIQQSLQDASEVKPRRLGFQRRALCLRAWQRNFSTEEHQHLRSMLLASMGIFISNMLAVLAILFPS